MPVNFKTKPILDALPGGVSPWAIGSGSTGLWSQNGTTTENRRVYDTDPWGNTSIVWETHPEVVSGADGGWNSSYPSIDNTKLYRFSVWARTTSINAGTDDGRFYLGCSGSPTAVDNMDDCTTNTNPYWFSGYYLYNQFTINEWYLHVGHVWPSDIKCQYGIDIHPNSGKWSISAGFITIPNIGHDFRFNPATTSIRHRTYHYYATDINARLQFYDPRIELCDGSEGTIESLLNGPTIYSGNTLGTTSITHTGASFKHQAVEATGGDIINEVGEWRFHMFTGDGSFDVTSYVGSALEVEYLIVGGGGGGGCNMGGGGGGGGVLAGECYLSGITYAITVGAGGNGAPAGTGTHPTTPGTNGGNSTFNGLTAYGGGYGGLSPNSYGYQDGNAGGCGGGASGYNNGAPVAVGGAGTAGQGYAGGDQGSAYYSGGGGGAGAVGVSGNSQADGGAGKFSSILGRPYYWGGGGGGAGYSIAGGDGGIGGGGGGAVGTPGGDGGVDSITWGFPGIAGATSSQANVPGGDGGYWAGGGGGGGSHYNYTNKGGDGGSGSVIIRYKYK